MSGTTVLNADSTQGQGPDSTSTAESETSGMTGDSKTSSTTDSTTSSSTGGEPAPFNCKDIVGVFHDDEYEGHPCETAYTTDGKLENGPNCDIDCTVPKCGDSIFNPNTIDKEQCDEGETFNQNNGLSFCTKQCQRNGRIAFVTNQKFSGKIKYGDLEGIDAAHAYCREAANSIPEAAENSNELVYAWLSVTSNKIEVFSPAKDFEKGNSSCNTPFFLPKSDFELRPAVANNVEELLNQDESPFLFLRHPIWTTETGEGVGFASFVMTGTGPDGHPDGDDCENYKSTTGKVTQGFSLDDSKSWTMYETIYPDVNKCSTERRLYCFEQCPPLQP